MLSLTKLHMVFNKGLQTSRSFCLTPWWSVTGSRVRCSSAAFLRIRPPLPPHTYESCLPSQKIFPYMYKFYCSPFRFCSKVKKRQLRAWVFRVPVHTSAAVRIWSSRGLQKRVMTWDILMLKVQCHEMNNILKKSSCLLL
jgi:hypothetical protein